MFFLMLVLAGWPLILLFLSIVLFTLSLPLHWVLKKLGVKTDYTITKPAALAPAKKTPLLARVERLDRSSAKELAAAWRDALAAGDVLGQPFTLAPEHVALIEGILTAPGAAQNLAGLLPDQQIRWNNLADTVFGHLRAHVLAQQAALVAARTRHAGLQAKVLAATPDTRTALSLAHG